MNQSSPETPFLEKDEGCRSSSLEEDELPQTLGRKRLWIRRQISALICHSVLILLYTIIVVVVSSNNNSKARLPAAYSPASGAITYEKVTISDSPGDVKKSLYVGKISPELDANWYKLLHYHNIRLTDDDLHQLNVTSVPLGGGGYQGMLAVMHNLHCLKLVREGLHPEHYYKDKSVTEIKSLKGHNEHCIDALRMAVMCRADLSIYPFHWLDDSNLPNPTWSQNHECVNWDRLTEWMDTRVVDITQPGELTHPKYGPSYPGRQRVSEPNGPKFIAP